MRTFETTALDAGEPEMVAELVERLRRELSDELVAVWLYGSRARGERHPESDIDLLVLTKRNGAKYLGPISVDMTLPRRHLTLRGYGTAAAPA